MVCLCWRMLLQWLVISFHVARAQNGQSFGVVHVLNAAFTGPANKDTGNPECVIGFIAFYCFGQTHGGVNWGKWNSEEHVDDTVLEHIWVEVGTWAPQTDPQGGYLSCFPPFSKTNPGDYYRCNTWTTEKNDNCHTPNLPWNDGAISEVGAKVPDGAKPVGGNEQWMFSFPAEGEGTTWWQGL